MRLPSIGTLMRIPGVDKATAKLCREVMATRDDRGLRELHLALFKDTIRWVNSCYNPPSKSEIRMSMLNDLLGGHGVECIDQQDDWSSYEDGPRWEYVSMGDTYALTIVRDNERDTYRVCSWGDIAEKMED